MRAPIAGELVMRDDFLSPQNCGPGNLPHLPRDTLDGMLHARVESTRVTMPSRLETAGRTI